MNPQPNRLTTPSNLLCSIFNQTACMPITLYKAPRSTVTFAVFLTASIGSWAQCQSEQRSIAEAYRASGMQWGTTEVFLADRMTYNETIKSWDIVKLRADLERLRDGMKIQIANTPASIRNAPGVVLGLKEWELAICLAENAMRLKQSGDTSLPRSALSPSSLQRPAEEPQNQRPRPPNQNGPEANTRPVQERAAEPLNQQTPTPTPTRNTNPQPNPQSPSNQSPSASIADSKRQMQDMQARGDAAAQRKGRRTHDPAAEAHHCLTLETSPRVIYGGFINSCGFRVEFVFCNYQPKPNSWGTSLDCSKKQGLGASHVNPNFASADHTNGAQTVYWFACKYPSWPVDVEYAPGQGLMARCRED